MGARTWLLVGGLLGAVGCDRLLQLDPITPIGVTGVAPWATVAAGTHHTCGIRTDGSLWCWGDNAADQGALGAVFEVTRPARVGAASWRTVAAAGDFTCGIQTDDTLWCWGYSSHGETGIGSLGAVSANDRVGFYIYVTPEPTQVTGTWKQIATGEYTACAIRDDATLWCWGNNSYAQLADPQTGIDRPSPIELSADPWLDVAIGEYHACAIRGDGTLWCWGHGNEGELGVGPLGAPDAVATPMQVTVAGVSAWAKVVIGDRTTCALPAADPSIGAQVYCWGANYDNVPIRVQLLGGGFDEVIDLAAGGRDTTVLYGDVICARRVDHSLWCWGDNGRDQLGPLAAGMPASTEPLLMTGGAASWSSVAVGVYHVCAVGDDASLWCVGNDSRGELGAGGGNQRVPLQVPGTWSSPTAGSATTCALDTAKHPACAGLSVYGGVGDGTRIDRQLLVPIAGGAPSQQLAVGAYHTCALGVDGKVWCWGYDGNGELGDASTVYVLVPEQVIAATYTAVGATDHTCAINAATLDVECWGANSSGELGDGGTTLQSTPRPLVTSMTFSSIAVGGYHTCAIAGGGTYCWGSDTYGQLGDNNVVTPYYSTSPVLVLGPSFASLTAGAFHTCGLDSAGGGWCWGDGQSGQLGIGGLGSVYYPSAIPGTWHALAAGAAHTCGIQSDGSLWCWGSNAWGQLGDGTFEARDTPLRVGTDTTWVDVTAGSVHTCATRADRTTWCWGNNDDGQLATGTAWIAQPQQVP